MSQLSTLLRCHIVSNAAAFGGGMHLNGGGTVDACVISANVATNDGAGSHGGIVLFGAHSYITRSDISHNYAEQSAGGATFYGGASVNQSVFIGNVCTQQWGVGGIFTIPFRGEDVLRNCLIISNRGDIAGGILMHGVLDGGVIRNSTIADNTATADDGVGGMYLRGQAFVYNAIVHGNSHANWSNESGVISYTCATPLPSGTGNIATDPLFRDGYYLDSTSPAINAGLNAQAALPVDLDGAPRILQAVVDMGCYEVSRDSSLEPPVISNPVVVSHAATGVYYHASYEPLWIDGAKDEDVWVAASHPDGAWLTNGVLQVLHDTLWSQRVSIVWTTTDSLETNVFAYRSADESLSPVSLHATVLLVLKDLYVHTAFTGAPGIVSHIIDSVVLAGTNSHQITGGMWIHNAANNTTIPFTSAPGWFAPALPLALGVNTITVYATNAFGTVASDTITIVRASMPALTITNTPAVYRVPFRYLWHTLAGESSNLAGDLLVSNTWRGATSVTVLPAASPWSAQVHLPQHGTYDITVSGTNAAGDTASASITIIRAKPQTIWMDR